MAWNDAVVGAVAGGGFALAGVALQQLFAVRSDRQRFRRERIARREDRCVQALTDLVVAGRRVQRALVDRDDESLGAQERLAGEVDHLTEAAALVRVLVTDGALLNGVEQFEQRAKQLQKAKSKTDDLLILTPLIALIQDHQARKVSW